MGSSSPPSDQSLHDQGSDGSRDGATPFSSSATIPLPSSFTTTLRNQANTVADLQPTAQQLELRRASAAAATLTATPTPTPTPECLHPHKPSRDSSFHQKPPLPQPVPSTTTHEQDQDPDDPDLPEGPISVVGTPVQRPSTAAPRASNRSVHSAVRNFLQLLKPAAPVLDSQIYMTTGAITVSFLLMAVSVLYRLEIYDQTQMNSGLLFGSLGTIVMCAVIIGTYLCQKWYHTRHMHVLLVNLAVCEFLLAVSFILEPVWEKAFHAGVGDGLTCQWLSTVREYLIMCSTVWTTCMAVDLYYLMTDPFTSPRLNRRKYRAISNALATLAAALMGFSNAFDAPVAVGNFCWVGAKKEQQLIDTGGGDLEYNLSLWVFIISPVVVSMAINLYVTCTSYNRFQDGGMAATLQTRHVLLKEGFLTTITFIVYSALLWGVYAGYWLVTVDTLVSEILSVLYAFLLSYRGSVAFILWCLYKKPSKSSSHTGTSSSRGGTGAATGTGTAAAMAGGEEREEDSDPSTDDASEEAAVRPQLNVALLNELVQFTTQGISQAVRMAQPPIPAASTTTTSSNTTTGPSDTTHQNHHHTFVLRAATSKFSLWNEIKFTDFYPKTFARLRHHFGIQDGLFLTSLSKCTTPKVSEGASGSFMFYSKDKSFIVKSLTSGESTFLHSFLDQYVLYMGTNENTFLTRFVGSFCIQLYGKNVFFVVMENVFDVQHGVSIHQRYDIKGSWIDRNAQKPKLGAEVTCRHCNLSFRYGIGRNICPNRAGPHEANVVLKDMDLTTKLRFGAVEGQKLLTQLKKDSDFLCDLGVMDYSLLLGVIEVSYQVNQQQILTRDGSVFLDQLLTDTSGTTSGNSNTTTTTTTTRIKQSTQCLRTSEVVIGPGFYYLGMIDILQQWNWSKRTERFIKCVLMRKDPEGISAMSPRAYRTRFHKKLDEIIHLGHNTEVAALGINTGGAGSNTGGGGSNTSRRTVLTETDPYGSQRRLQDQQDDSTILHGGVASSATAEEDSSHTGSAINTVGVISGQVWSSSP